MKTMFKNSILLISITLLCLVEGIYQGKCGENCQWVLDEEIIKISGNGPMDDFASTTEQPWRGCQSIIHHIVIEKGITSIGSYAFSSLSNLGSISISEGVESIGERAFEGDDYLSVTIPASVTTIGKFAFSRLNSITVTSGSTHFSTDEEGVLYNYGKTTVVRYPCSKSGNSYTIPDGVTTIGDGAFKNCEYIKNLTIGNDVTTIGDEAFSGMSSMTELNISAVVTSIGRSAFVSCTSLYNISVAEGNAFYSSDDGVLFQELEGNKKAIICYPPKRDATSYTIPDDVTVIADEAFADATKLNEQMIIPNGVTTIGNKAFSGCSLKSVSIGNSVNSIGTAPFYGCSSLTTISVNTENSWYTSNGDDKILFTKDMKKLIQVPQKRWSSAASYTIPTGIQSIEPYAFYKTQVSSLTIPTSVKTIGTYAFYACSSLGSLTFPEKSLVESIEDFAFSSCSKLNTVTLKGNLKTIGNSAFASDSYLTSVTISNEVTSIGRSAFAYCSSLSTLTLGSKLKTIGSLAFQSCGLYNVDLVIPNEVTYIGYNAFESTKLKSVKLGAKVEHLGVSAFYWCKRLESFSVESGNSHFKANQGALFDYEEKTLLYYPTARSLASFTIPDTTIVIKKGALYECTSLEEVIFGEKVETIEEEAFSYCDKISTISFPASVKLIEPSAFYRCLGIESFSVADGNKFYSVSEEGILFNIDKTVLVQYPLAASATNYSIPASVKEVGGYAFSGATNLTDISLNNVEIIGPSAFNAVQWTSLIISDKVKKVGTFAFVTSTLVNVTIGENLESLGSRAFESCSSLKAVFYQGLREDFATRRGDQFHYSWPPNVCVPSEYQEKYEFFMGLTVTDTELCQEYQKMFTKCLKGVLNSDGVLVQEKKWDKLCEGGTCNEETGVCEYKKEEEKEEAYVSEAPRSTSLVLLLCVLFVTLLL